MNRGGKYCPLGVACELYQKHVGKLKTQKFQSFCDLEEKEEIRYNGSTFVLPIKVKEWLGLRHYCGAYNKGAITWLNDSKFLSFKQIAQRIRTLKTLFVDV